MSVKSVFGGGGGAPTDAQYVALATDASLTAERVLTAGAGISLTDAGAGGAVTVAATAGAAGKILQVVHVPFTGLYATTSTTFNDVAVVGSTMQASITPSADTSTILIQVSVNLSVKYQAHGYWRVWDGSAAVSGGVADPAHALQESGLIFSARTDWNATSSTQVAGYATTILDAPATVSAVTYTVQAKSSSSSPVTVNQNTRNSNVLVDSPGISSITLFEIGA